MDPPHARLQLHCVLALFQQAGFVCESELSIDYSCQEKATPSLMPLPIGAL